VHYVRRREIRVISRGVGSRKQTRAELQSTELPYVSKLENCGRGVGRVVDRDAEIAGRDPWATDVVGKGDGIIKAVFFFSLGLNTCSSVDWEDRTKDGGRKMKREIDCFF
jgi:hypothetical protein